MAEGNCSSADLAFPLFALRRLPLNLSSRLVFLTKTQWHRVVAFTSASPSLNAVHKGDHVLVDGQFLSSKYGRENAKSKKTTAARVSVPRKRELRSRLIRAEAEAPI
jgi:hypothetical protein